MAVNLFIDTNILLSFYHYTSEDLEELKKLAVLVEKKKVLLLLPEQVKHEFSRNRESKIADALKGLKEQTLALQFPQICKDYPEFEQLRTLQRDYQKAHAALLEKVMLDAGRVDLKADQVVYQLFHLATTIPTTPAIVAQAQERVALGNPPGKNGSLGDAINWEALLDNAPSGEKLHFVTEDRDYRSALDPTSFSSFLLDEWLLHKEPQPVLYSRLSDFFTSEFPKIKLASQIEKDLLIDQLAQSPDFRNTHHYVAKLMRRPEFTTAQADAILSAAANNTQVGWIAGDEDVRRLLEVAISGREKQLDQENLAEVRSLMGEEEPEEIPF